MTHAPLLRASRVAVFLVALLILPVLSLAAQPDDLACQQQPGNRFFWLERAFCDLPTNGPDRANGVIIWNHGMSGTTQSWLAPAPSAFRLLQTRGWDVIMLKRHHAAGTQNTLYRTVQRTLQEAAALKKSGYRKVVLAGQSFGGYVTLEAVDTSPDIDAAIALAPGVRSRSADGRLDASITERILQRAKVGRLALVFPKNDALFGYLVRGEAAEAILSRRIIPYLLLDENSGLSGHGGGVTGRFALRYGLCLVDFLAAPSLPHGRFTCPPVSDEWPLVRELLLPPSTNDAARLSGDASALPEPVKRLRGFRWAMLEDTVVLVAPIASEPGRVRLIYRSTGIGGGVFDATLSEGGIRAVLANKSTVTLSSEGEGTITWNTLHQGPPNSRPRGSLDGCGLSLGPLARRR
jgi:pimeloyl-ACP methyl ester carboxylesterase